MVRWLVPILLTALALAALPGRVSLGCDAAVAEAMGCGERAEETLAKASSCCTSEAVAEPPPTDLPACGRSSTAPANGEAGTCAAGDADHACSFCTIVCGALCERASPWGILGMGLGTDGLAHAAPSGVLLPETQWLPRGASRRFPSSALEGDWVTFDRPRRQAKLCVWTV